MCVASVMLKANLQSFQGCQAIIQSEHAQLSSARCAAHLSCSMSAEVNVCHAHAQDHLLEVLKPGLAERCFSDGEYLIRQGDQGTHLLYIMEGAAEVLLKLSNPRVSEHRR